MDTEKERLYVASRSSIRVMVEFLRDRGTIFVGTPSVECLAAHLSGWFYAQGDRAADQEVWDHFLKFVAKKYRDTEHRSWNALIGFHSLNSYEAYGKFFSDFDESVAQLLSTMTNANDAQNPPNDAPAGS